MPECDILILNVPTPNSIPRRAFLGALAVSAFADSRADEKAAGFRLGAASFSLKNFSRARTIEMLQLCRVEAVSVKEGAGGSPVPEWQTMGGAGAVEENKLAGRAAGEHIDAYQCN